jgi:putative ABC transport system permease protein
MGPDILSITKSYSEEEKKPSPDINMQDALDILQYCPMITHAAPYTSIYCRIQYNGKELWAPSLGITDNFFDLNKLSLKQGRFFSELDGDACYCVVGHEIAEKLCLAGAKKLIGTAFSLNKKKFTIIGVLEKTEMGGMRPYEINHGIMIPFSTVKRISNDIMIKDIIARMRSKDEHIQAASQLTDYFQERKNLRVEIRSAEAIIENMKEQSRMFTLLLGIIGSIALVVGGIGVMNMMLVSVTERKKEIGIRRALGARQSDIYVQFLIEAAMLCLIGGIAGSLFGISASYFVARLYKWQFLIAYHAVFLGVGVSAAVGIFFGFYPARQAAKFDPIVALRTE